MVALQDSVRVYRFAKPPSFLAAYQTADNPWGLCCLSSSESGRIAFPGRTAGHVQLVEIETGNVSIFPAHSSAVRAMQMSPDGELLATASEKVRFFSICICWKAGASDCGCCLLLMSNFSREL